MASGLDIGGGVKGRAKRARGAVVFGVFATLAFAVLAGRLVQLQVMEHDHLAVEAARQVYGVVRDRDKRGSIVDVNGVTLAASVAAKACALDPKVFLDKEGARPDKLVSRLAEKLSLSPAEVQRIAAGLEKRRTRQTDEGPVEEPFRFLWIKQRMSEEQWKALKADMEQADREAAEAWRNRRQWLKKAGEKKVARQAEAEKVARDAAEGWRKVALEAEGRYAGVFFPPEYERVYPQGQLASHILGFCMLDGGVDGLGVEGIEKACDELLRGIPVNRVVARDARSRALSTLVADDRKTDGMTVRLTVDSVVQSIVEEELGHTVDNLSKEFPEVTGNCVVMDPWTGDIIAIANYPTFDPNRPGEFPSRNRRNDAVAAVQEPGSTFKPLVLAASIEEKLAKFEEEIDCSSFKMENGRTIKDIHPFGRMSLLMALGKSSNPAMVRVGLRLGPEKMRKYVTAYGFGQKTGSRLPGEVNGRVTPADKWSSYTMGSVPMGYEVNVTAIQMAAAYSVIANGGMLPRPNIVKSVHDETGKVALAVEPVFVRRVLSPETTALMRKALRTVVTDGTGRRANIEEYEIGGKTGTANMIANARERAAGIKGYSKTRHTANFVSLAPWDKPRVVICVSIRDTGKYGGEASSPVGAAIARRVLAYWGVPTVNGEAIQARALPARPVEPEPVPAAYTVGEADDDNQLDEEVDPRLWEDWVEEDGAVG